ncbi:transposase, partial [filamentous cyanobacterium LEGE 11480]
LVPALKPGQVVVMDNASFHKSERMRQLIEQAGCVLLFLPPYSPDLNKIEKFWARLKHFWASTYNRLTASGMPSMKRSAHCPNTGLDCNIGPRSRDGAMGLWQSLPAIYRQCAVCCTDFWEAYKQVIPGKRHQAVGKDSGLTSYIERFNLTLRQRVSRLVRRNLAFSKKLANHIGAIWDFIHHYNVALPVCLTDLLQALP